MSKGADNLSKMNEIRLLDNDLINKIAAGEVVERPASVVKELVENALDAGSTRITVEIQGGGLDLIKVTDNGCGIPRNHLPHAFLRHATSKISTDDDLFAISTMGFRGEALASIAAVAQVTMTSRTGDTDTGFRVGVAGGVYEGEREVAALIGTCVEVRNLFYNTPARKKFLKKPGTEGGAVSDLVTRLAIGRPDISFAFNNNSVNVFSTSGKGLRNVVLSVFGRNTAEKMIDCEYTMGLCKVSGLIGNLELSRGNRGHGNFFVNGRYIKNGTVQSAVEAAYKGRLTVGKFPVYILNLQIPPALVDINVHPAKLEARFSNDIDVFRLVLGAADTALRQSEAIPIHKFPASIQNISVNNTTLPKMPNTPTFPQPKPTIPPLSYNEGDRINQIAEPITGYIPNFASDVPTLQYIYLDAATRQNEVVADDPPAVLRNYRIVGQFFGCFWLLEDYGTGTCYIVDQHAAHERLLYDEITEKLTGSGIISQRVIEPIAMNLTPRESAAVAENARLLSEIGFEIETMYGNTVAIRSLPYFFESVVNVDFFMEILDKLADEDGEGTVEGLYSLRTDAIARLACRAAVKANDRLADSEARALVNRIMQDNSQLTCPHGRPIITEVSRKDIDKMFKRVQ